MKQDLVPSRSLLHVKQPPAAHYAGRNGVGGGVMKRALALLLDTMWPWLAGAHIKVWNRGNARGFAGHLIINYSSVLCVAFGGVGSKGAANQPEQVCYQPNTAHAVKSSGWFLDILHASGKQSRALEQKKPLLCMKSRHPQCFHQIKGFECDNRNFLFFIINCLDVGE